MTTNDTAIPNIWETLKDEGPDVGLSGLINIWQSRLRCAKSDDTSTPKTVLCVTFTKMVNLIPQDAPHPLYSPDYYDLTDRFILDHLCLEELNLDDEKLNAQDGVTLKTISGMDLVFKKDADKITVNGIEVEDTKTLSDGTKGIIIKGFLFNHFEETKNAFRNIMTNITNEFCPLSRP